MSNKDRALQGLIGTALDLDIICICQRLNEGVPNILVFRDVMLKASDNRVIVFHGLAVGLQMVRSRCLVFKTKQSA